ncbi:MAG: hypothetical protein V7K53_10455 [Nostoc sp.]|uniref:hypothetical protein n=1 Tax=Nostoc sp. TaxID=1180 RepID=UPI002FFAC31E
MIALIAINNNEHAFYVYNLSKGEIIKKVQAPQEMYDLSSLNKGRPILRPFGISFDEKIIYVISNSVLGMFDYQYNYLGKFALNFSVNTHQILVQDRKLYVCQTSKDLLSIINLDNLEQEHYNIIEMRKFEDVDVEVPNYFELDQKHLNSVRINKGIMYCSYCGKGSDLNGSELKCYELETKKYIKTLIFSKYPHNIGIIDEKIYTISTYENSLNTSDGEQFELNFPGFARGLAMTKNFAFIGVGGDRNTINDGHVLKFDLNQRKVVDIMKVEKSGAITEIRLLNETDYAHKD